MGLDSMANPTAGPKRLVEPLIKVPLGRLSSADVATIVQKVVATQLDQVRINAAKFSSFI
jgi:hypothetical protein